MRYSLYSTSAVRLLALCELLFTLYLYSGNICHVMFALIKSESVPIRSDYPSRTVDATFLGQFWNLFTFSRKQQQIFITCRWHYHISVPDYPNRTVKSKSLRIFCNFSLFCLLYDHTNTINLHMTNSKLRNSDSAYSICISQVLLKLFTFLLNTADKEIPYCLE